MSNNNNIQKIRLGLCCLNTQLREQKPPIFNSRSCIQATVEKKGWDYARELAQQNLLDLIPMMQWNYENGISVFRLSSDMFPHITNHRLDLSGFDLSPFEGLLKKIGKFARSRGQRLSFHPGQFNVLGTPNLQALRTTIYELHIHATIFDMMECDQDSTMVIHGGGVYGDKEKTIDRWCRNYMKLPIHIRRRLVLENCEKNFNLEDCLRISERVSIPVVLDNHHFDCYNKLHPDNPHPYPIEYYIPLVLETWQRRGIRPEFHISEQGNGKTGHHSDFISHIPDYYLNIPREYGVGVDIMVEAKMKEQAIMKLYDMYPHLKE